MERSDETSREIIIDIEEEDEEEQICRYCHSHGDSQNPLQYPCLCSGSIKFVHQKCLFRWLKEKITFLAKQKKQITNLECELCSHNYSIYRGYAKDSPTILPFKEFMNGVARKARPLLPLYMWYCLVVLFRLFVLPLFAFHLWSLRYPFRFLQEKGLDIQGPVPLDISSTIMMDWLYGIGYVIVYTKVRERRRAIGAIDPVPGNEENHNADEIGEAGEAQATAHLGNAWLGLLKALFQSVHRLMVIFFEIIFLRFHFDDEGRTFIQRLMDSICGQFTYHVLIFAPFPLGRALLHYLSLWFFAAWSIITPFTKSALHMQHAFGNSSAEIQKDGLLSGAIEVVAETFTANSIGPGEALSSIGKQPLVYRSSGIYDAIILATGYMVVVPLLFVCYGVPVRTVASKIRCYLRKFLTIMVYTFFLMIHLGVLPLVYGWWLDVCTTMLFGKTISDRVEFLSSFPILSTSIHWMVGIVYMFQIQISASLLRRVLDKDVLHFLQESTDPFFNMLRVLTDDMKVQARQFLFSIVVNGLLLICLIFLPAFLALRLAPAIFPLHISVTDPFTEIPVVMVLLQTVNSTVYQFTLVASVAIIVLFS